MGLADGLSKGLNSSSVPIGPEIEQARSHNQDCDHALPLAFWGIEYGGAGGEACEQDQWQEVVVALVVDEGQEGHIGECSAQCEPR